MSNTENYPGLKQRLCITAGAGAGKTRRLVGTYLGLLTGAENTKPLDPNQIVAITFTEKAANEMRARVALELSKLAQDPKARTDRDWHVLLSQVEWAPISTIHSFCGLLLREYGAQLGLDPDFAVLDEVEFEDLLQEVIQGVLRQELALNSKRLKDILAQKPLAGSYGVSSIISGFYHELATMGLNPAKAREQTYLAHENEKAKISDLIRQLELALDDLSQERHGKLADSKAQFVKKLDLLLKKWPEFETKIKNLGPESSLPLKEMAVILKGNWGKIRELKNKTLEIVNELQSLACLPWAQALADNFLSLLEEVQAKLDHELSARAAISFDLLLLKARDLLLYHPETLHRMREQWKAVLVDEFQDVNPVQGHLMRLLAGLVEPDCHLGTSQAELPRLMVVGDRKQSIYAFRGADVTQFSNTMQEFEQGAGLVEALPNNYRTCHDLVDFFNRCFKNVFQERESEDTNYLELYLNFRDDDAQSPAREKIESKYSDPLQVLSINAPEGANSETWRFLEAASLAAYVKDLINYQGVKPGKIAILMTRLTSVGIYEEAFRKAQVGFYTVKGRGFFACQEISDLLLGLKVLLNPMDELALAGFLRSPLAGLSDESLLALALDENGQKQSIGKTFASEYACPGFLGLTQRKQWQKCRILINEISGLAKRMPPVEVLEALLDKTDYIPILMAQEDGEQKSANIRKLLEIARDFSLGSKGSTEHFVCWLQDMVSDPGQEPQAPLMGEEADVVRFMTVHQSKGLEFDVVALVDLDATRSLPKGLPSPLPNGVFAIKPLDFATGEVLESPIYSKLAQRRKAVFAAETARLFYVACTRAMEKLIICHRKKEKGPKGLWSKWTEKYILTDEAVCVLDDSELAVDRSFLGNQEQEKAISPDFSDQSVLDEIATGICDRVFDKKRQAPQLLRRSVSILENFLTCPRLYFYTKYLGLDTANLPNFQDNSKSQIMGHLALTGSLVHKILELTDLKKGPQQIDLTVEQLAFCKQAEIKTLEKACQLAKGVWDTELPQYFQDLPQENMLREQAFKLFLQGGQNPSLEITGEFDLVLIRAEQIVIIDYKVTNHIEPEKYRHQLGIYALALSKIMQGKIPVTMLCYLGDQGGRLVELNYSKDELAEIENQLLFATGKMSQITLDSSPEDLPCSPGCNEQCPLLQSNICSGGKAGGKF